MSKPGATKCQQRKPSSPCRKFLLQLADSAICLFVMFPVLLCYWRGIQDIFAVWVFPEHRMLNIVSILCVGLLSPVGYLVAPVLDRWMEGRQGSWAYWCVAKIFMFTYGAMLMCLWYGLWNFADHILGRSLLPALPWLFCSLAALVMLRCTRGTMWPPVLLTMDTRPDVFQAANRFGTKPEDNYMKYMADSIFTQVVINSFAIMVWRSAWIVMDVLIYPEDALRADIVCFAIGMPFSGILLLLQTPMSNVSAQLDLNESKLCKILWEDFVYLVTLVALLLLWRGGWNLNVRFFFSDPVLGGIINHLVGVTGMLILGVTSYIGGLGCSIDGADPGGTAIYPIRYVQEVFGRPYKQTATTDTTDTDEKKDPRDVKGEIWL